jgi:putative membrane protein
MKTRTFASVLCTLATASLSLAQVQHAPTGNQHAAPAPSQQAASQSQAQSQPVTEADQKFLDTVRNANTYGVESSKLALKSSNNDQIKAFANVMIKDHSGANEAVGKLAESLGTKLPTELNPQFSKMLNELKDKSGDEFDKAYAKAHLQLHITAVNLFDKTSKEGDNPQVKKFAATVLPTLQHHLVMAKQLPGNENAQDREN